jgi:hypothetical protein
MNFCGGFLIIWEKRLFALARNIDNKSNRLVIYKNNCKLIRITEDYFVGILKLLTAKSNIISGIYGQKWGRAKYDPFLYLPNCSVDVMVA